MSCFDTILVPCPKCGTKVEFQSLQSSFAEVLVNLDKQCETYTDQIEELLFALEAALPFVEAGVGGKLCSSNGSPAAIRELLKKHDWENKWPRKPRKETP